MKLFLTTVFSLFTLFFVPQTFAQSTSKLRYPPPQLTNPTTINVTTSQGKVTLGTTKDYIINLPKQTWVKSSGFVIDGGRNVVLIGGDIRIPNQGTDPTINERRCLMIQNSTGTVHIEGLYCGGEDITEGIQTKAPNAVIQIQNVRIDAIHARDQIDFTDNHPDLIQTWGSVKEIRVYNFTGSSDYQGFLFKADSNRPHGKSYVTRANIYGIHPGRYLFMSTGHQDQDDIIFEDFFIKPSGTGNEFERSVTPDKNGLFGNGVKGEFKIDEFGRKYVTWADTLRPRQIGRITEGVPPGGDFVPAGVAGYNYTSPGYSTSTSPLPTPTPRPTSNPASPTPTRVLSETASFTGITNGQTVNGTLFVTYSIDPINVSNVSFYINGTVINTESQAPFYLGGDVNNVAKGYSVDNLTNGTHTLEAKITSDDGIVQTDSITFNKGTVTPTSTPTPTPLFPPPSYWSSLPPELRGFLEVLYINVCVSLRPSNQSQLLNGIATCR